MVRNFFLTNVLLCFSFYGANNTVKCFMNVDVHALNLTEAYMKIIGTGKKIVMHKQFLLFMMLSQ